MVGKMGVKTQRPHHCIPLLLSAHLLCIPLKVTLTLQCHSIREWWIRDAKSRLGKDNYLWGEIICRMSIDSYQLLNGAHGWLKYGWGLGQRDAALAPGRDSGYLAGLNSELDPWCRSEGVWGYSEYSDLQYLRVWQRDPFYLSRGAVLYLSFQGCLTFLKAFTDPARTVSCMQVFRIFKIKGIHSIIVMSTEILKEKKA